MGWQTVDVLLLKSIDGSHVAFDVGWQTVDVILWSQQKETVLPLTLSLLPNSAKIGCRCSKSIVSPSN